MRPCVLDLDGSIVAQESFLRRHRPEIVRAERWGPRLRMECRHGAFRRFERHLANRLGGFVERERKLTFVGSGDFHHVTLALLRRLRGPFNLLVIDKHPDWVRGVPILHCGTWLWHALRLPNLRRVFHVGGDLDFDNGYRWLAPWRELHGGRVVVVPARRRYDRGHWAGLPHRALVEPAGPAGVGAALDEALAPHRAALARWPLYVSLDKDVMDRADAVVNWDSGTLRLGQVLEVIDWFRGACRGQLAGADVLGDWSPVRLRWGVRTLCHWAEHPRLRVDAGEAAERNAYANDVIAAHLRGTAAPALVQPAACTPEHAGSLCGFHKAA